MNPELPKTYTPSDYEKEIYTKWEESGFFNPEKQSETQGRYCNVLPPPNANGELHLGHASGYATMDLFGRFNRMCGKKTLLLPGKDHAGIQTQVVFEKKLFAERGLSRHNLGREKFFSECYSFCEDRSQYMRSQEKRIGLSADWSREKFTLDPKVSERAKKTFVRMHEDGLIYRGERIINWCPRCSTALSDIEVIHKETEGKLFHFIYPVKDSTESVTVATTRPETMLGDTAVAVHPDDSRYASLIGKTLLLPIVNREIPVIADDRVDKAFGTGAVKITPAHDPLDWAIAETHKLPAIQVIGKDAKMTAESGKFFGMSVEQAREEVLRELTALGNFLHEENHTLNLSSCERCKTVIEPLISKQWFVKVDASENSLKQKAIQGIQNGDIAFYPETMKNQMIRWLENLHDWCISRQLWWGHQIPAFYCLKCDPDKNTPFISQESAPLCPICKNKDVLQDPDTLDTWFSSGQWPYTTLGYPEEKDAKDFYPTDTMIMGRDLLFFWAARMILFGYYTTQQAPFKNLYFTGLVRDENGLKMSKSKGNGIDVLEMIDQFGADAVRMSLIVGATPGLDFRLSEKKISGFRNFVNKLWNVGRYIAQTEKKNETQEPSAADHWILFHLEKTVREVTRLIENYQFSLAGETLREFTWSHFADWYVEVHKMEKNDIVLTYVFETLLKLWHPFMPFVTETLWKETGRNTLLMIEKWPNAKNIFSKIEQDIHISVSGMESGEFEYFVREPIVQIRNLRTQHRIPVSSKPKLFISDMPAHGIQTPEKTRTLLERNSPLFARLARVENIDFLSEIPQGGIPLICRHFSGFLLFEKTIDTEKEKIRLTKELEHLTALILNTETRLANPEYRKNAPEKIVKQTEGSLVEYHTKKENIEKQLQEL